MDKLKENIKKTENKKRKHSPTPSSSNNTIQDDDDFVEPSSKILVEEAPFSLIDLCDEILIEIFLYLKPKSLLTLSETCNRLHLLIHDYRLWKNVDLTDEQLGLNEIKKRLLGIDNHTKTIKLRGFIEEYPQEVWKTFTFSDYLLKNIINERCENLQTLELHHCYINNENFDIIDFPLNLKRLVFNDCYVRWSFTPAIKFKRIDTHLKKLEELHIEFCNWFNTHDLVAFSKVVSLKRLSIKGCNNLKEFVPYGSLAARFGFKTLESLDLRETPITDSDLQCFNSLPNLKELLIECPAELRCKPPLREVATNANHNIEVQLSSQQQEDQQLQTLRRRPPNPERPANVMHPGRFFIVNFYMNPNQELQDEAGGGDDVRNDGGPRIGGRVLPIPQMHELHPGSVQEQIENALRNVLQQQREGNGEGGPSGRRRTASIYFAPAKITDRGICSYGTARVPVQRDVVCIRAEPRSPDTRIEKLILRHYRYVTDISLRHLVQCAPNLKFIDLTGTGVTEEGVNIFKIEKPNCHIISDYVTG